MSVRNILDRSIPLDGFMPENLTATDIKAERMVQGYYMIADDSLRGDRSVIVGTETGNITKIENGHIEAYDLHVENVEAKVEVMTPAITLGGTQVLTPTRVEDKQSIAVTYSDGSTATLSNTAISETTNFNSQQHMLTCQTQIASTSKSFKQLIIPTGLDFTGRKTQATCTTVAVINNTDMFMRMVHIYVEDNQLMVKVVFSETPSYTSIAIKINIVYN